MDSGSAFVGSESVIPLGRKLNPLPLLDGIILPAFLKSIHTDVSHAQTIWKHFIRNQHQLPQPTFQGMKLAGSNAYIPNHLYAALEKRFQFLTSKVVSRITSRDRSTTKLLIELMDGHRIEAVIIRHFDREQKKQKHIKKNIYKHDLTNNNNSNVENEEDSKKEENGIVKDNELENDFDSDDDEITQNLNQTSLTSSPSISTSSTPLILSSPSPTPSSQGLEIQKRPPRTTLCVSSQVGCAMACTFCATGTMGRRADLTAGEIIEQIIHAQAAVDLEKNPLDSKAVIRNVVMMGMGEPMSNYNNVLTAVKMMVDNSLFGLAPRSITVSTVGIVPRMLQLAHDAPRISLALSLHAPNQALREKLVPVAKLYDMEKLISALDKYQEITKRPVMIEYILLKNVNDRLHHAHELGFLLKGKDLKVNLIPYNVTDVKAAYQAPLHEDVFAFAAVLRSSPYNLLTTVREEMGADIDGACGQLAVQTEKQNSCGSNKPGPCAGADIEDLLKEGTLIAQFDKKTGLPLNSNNESKDECCNEGECDGCDNSNEKKDHSHSSIRNRKEKNKSKSANGNIKDSANGPAGVSESSSDEKPLDLLDMSMKELDNLLLELRQGSKDNKDVDRSEEEEDEVEGTKSSEDENDREKILLESLRHEAANGDWAIFIVLIITFSVLAFAGSLIYNTPNSV